MDDLEAQAKRTWLANMSSADGHTWNLQNFVLLHSAQTKQLALKLDTSPEHVYFDVRTSGANMQRKMTSVKIGMPHAVTEQIVVTDASSALEYFAQKWS